MTIASNKPNALHARIVRGSFVLLSGSGLTAAINLAYNVAVARFLGPNGFGQATAVYTLLTLISAVTLSYQLISAKAVAQHGTSNGLGKDETVDLRSFGRSAWMSGLLIAAALLIFRDNIASYLHLSSPALVVLLAIGSVFYVPLGSRRGLIQGAYGFRSLATNLVLEGVVRLGGSVIMASLGYGVKGVIAANAAAVAAAYFIIAPPQTKLSTASTGKPLRYGGMHRELAQAMIFFSGQVLINNCDIVLVKHFFTPNAAGLYAVVAMVGRVIFALCQAVVNSMVPVVAGTRDEERKSLSLISTSLSLVLGIGIVLAAGLRFAPATVWSSLFGPGFLLSGSHGFPYLLALYALMTVIYSLSAVMITYEMSYKIANTSWVQLVFSVLIIAGICEYHSSLQQVIVVQLILVSIMLVLVATPFLRMALREKKLADTRSAPIRLIRRVSEDDVIAEFLKSDFGKGSYGRYHKELQHIVYEPDLTNKDESAKRRALFSVQHLALWNEIPVDTEWYEAELQEADLSHIRVFPRAQWRKIAHGNFALQEVAKRFHEQGLSKNQFQDSAQGSSMDLFFSKITAIRECLAEKRPGMGAVLLIGTDGAKPLAIIDGNHRLVAAVLEGQMHQLRFLCGLSPKMAQCCWYKTNLRTLVRYGSHLLKHLARNPEAELTELLQNVRLSAGPQASFASEI